MAILRYQPWSTFTQLQDEVNKVFEQGLRGNETDPSNVATSQWLPAVDIKDEPDRFLILADIPGVDPKDIDVTMDKGTLTIKGEKHFEKEDKGHNYSRRERSTGMFYRRFSLPDTADADSISAKGKHGVLEIIIPKNQKNQTRKIDIKVQE